MTEWRRVSFLIVLLDLRAWHAQNTPSGERAAHDGHGHRGCSSATLRRPCAPALPKAHPQALSSAGREHWGTLIMRVRSPRDAGTAGPAGNGSSATRNSSLFRPHPHQNQASKTSHSLPDLSSGQSSSRHGRRNPRKRQQCLDSQSAAELGWACPPSSLHLQAGASVFAAQS